MGIEGTRNPMPGLVRFAYQITGGPKQPGRRFGPMPFALARPGVGQRTLERMTSDHREAGYRAQTGRLRRQPTSQDDVSGAPEAYARLMGLTPKQRRRSWHKELSGARIAANQTLARAADAALAEVPVQRERKEVTA